MPIAIITGSCGLVGSEAVRFFSEKGLDVVGIDNDLRSYFFGKEASTLWNRKKLRSSIQKYRHLNLDIRNLKKLEKIFSEYQKEIQLIIHCAAQPSHDWAAREPFTDFSINATGTLNLLEMTRLYAPEAAFIFMSTNKVYGDTPNRLPLIERETRWEIDPNHRFAEFGIDESMSIDMTTHSLFGASKAASDLIVQEYGRYFGMKTVCFRGGCLTGSGHSGAKLHGFLAYLVKCALHKIPYQIIGYKGKQVRDNIHASDLVNAFWHYFQNPRAGEVYNMGGGRFSNCSILEAIEICERVGETKLETEYLDSSRKGDHIWWVGDLRKFKEHYPSWDLQYNIERIITEIIQGQRIRK
ncbi:MAG: NAD-dependent epimerase/dehydratase family protein [Verrucomicrobia bacterium]|nr:NAD-dependent epimerase/dehydratase family protein [Verrucomicrobiota bacterium]